MTKLQKLGVVLLCWTLWVFFCGLAYAVTGNWLMDESVGARITAAGTALVSLIVGMLLASGEIK